MPLPTLDETKTVEQGRSDAPPATLKKCRSAGTLQEVAQHVDRRRSVSYTHLTLPTKA